eukprot:m.1139243 g.1139243  ORF g.1139243 m.1139243 type:complete len:55 (+) comp24441_c0_seq78:3597-3761(+)
MSSKTFCQEEVRVCLLKSRDMYYLYIRSLLYSMLPMLWAIVFAIAQLQNLDDYV